MALSERASRGVLTGSQPHLAGYDKSLGVPSPEQATGNREMDTSYVID
jgi:hypothetical protein